MDNLINRQEPLIYRGAKVLRLSDIELEKLEQTAFTENKNYIRVLNRIPKYFNTSDLFLCMMLAFNYGEMKGRECERDMIKWNASATFSWLKLYHQEMAAFQILKLICGSGRRPIFMNSRRKKVLSMPNELINTNAVETLDSREVAKMIDMKHKHLLEKVRNYEHILLSRNLGSVDFFIPNEYKDSTGRTLNCYLLTKKGCEMVANKLTGEKGVLFTAQYVNRFEEMEKKIACPALPTNYLEALERLVDEVKMNEQLVLENNQLRFRLECKELEEKHLFTIEEIAKEHQMSARALNSLLESKKIQYTRKGRWYLYKRYKNKGYTKAKHNWLKWTNEGKLFIEQILAS